MNNIRPRDMQVFEILSEINKQKSNDLKLKTLKEKYYDHTPLHRILKMNYCDTIISMLPEGTPPFASNENPDSPAKSSLWEYLQVFPTIVRSTQSLNMKPLQIERSFIEMLQAVDPAEANVICLAKDKKLDEEYSISADLVIQAFPALNITNSAPKPEEPPKTKEELAAEYLEKAKIKKTEARKLMNEAKTFTKKAEDLINENA